MIRLWKEKQVSVINVTNGQALILDAGKAEFIPESELGKVISDKCEICGLTPAKYRDLSIKATRNKLPWKNVCEGCSHTFCMGYKAPLEMESQREKLWEMYLKGRNILFEDVV